MHFEILRGLGELSGYLLLRNQAGSCSLQKPLKKQGLYRPQKGRLLIENLENPDFGSGGLCGAIFILKCMERVARKLRRIILLHFGRTVVSFRNHFGTTRKRIIS